MRQHDTCFLIPDVITDAVQEKGSPREFQNCRDFLSIWLSSIWRTLQRSDLFWGHTGRIGLPAYTVAQQPHTGTGIRAMTHTTRQKIHGWVSPTSYKPSAVDFPSCRTSHPGSPTVEHAGILPVSALL